VLVVVCLDEVLQDCAGLENVNIFTVWEGAVGDRWDTAVGIDGHEPGFLLRSTWEVDFLNFIGNAELLKGYGDFSAIGCLCGIQCD